MREVRQVASKCGNSYLKQSAFIFVHSHLLTPWCRVLLEKLTALQPVKKFPAFRVTRRFVTALTSVRHLSLSWASPIQSIYPHSTSWRSILILSAHLRLGLPRLQPTTRILLQPNQTETPTHIEPRTIRPMW